MVERLSSHDDTLIGGYGVHIQRYQFALGFCRDKHVLDAGCGVGYGSIYLARSGAASVTAVDLSPTAIKEASETYRRSNLNFSVADVEKLDQCEALPARLDAIVNFENIEHLPHPKEFLGHARKLLAKPDGVLLTSTPNGDISELDPAGKPCNLFHVKEFKRGEFLELLSPYFGQVSLYGQWQTYDGRLRVLRDRQIHEQLCEMYFNPVARAGRMIKKMLGKTSLPAPKFTGLGDAFSSDYCIAPLDDPPFGWAPTVLIAVCTG